MRSSPFFKNAFLVKKIKVHYVIIKQILFPIKVNNPAIRKLWPGF